VTNELGGVALAYEHFMAGWAVGIEGYIALNASKDGPDCNMQKFLRPAAIYHYCSFDDIEPWSNELDPFKGVSKQH
jgi:hypothetical protein